LIVDHERLNCRQLIEGDEAVVDDLFGRILFAPQRYVLDYTRTVLPKRTCTSFEVRWDHNPHGINLSGKCKSCPTTPTITFRERAAIHEGFYVKRSGKTEEQEEAEEKEAEVEVAAKLLASTLASSGFSKVVKAVALELSRRQSSRKIDAVRRASIETTMPSTTQSGISTEAGGGTEDDAADFDRPTLLSQTGSGRGWRKGFYLRHNDADISPEVGETTAPKLACLPRVQAVDSLFAEHASTTVVQLLDTKGKALSRGWMRNVGALAVKRKTTIKTEGEKRKPTKGGISSFAFQLMSGGKRRVYVLQ
jgi:hypothetical protein